MVAVAAGSLWVLVPSRRVHMALRVALVAVAVLGVWPAASSEEGTGDIALAERTVPLPAAASRELRAAIVGRQAPPLPPAPRDREGWLELQRSTDAALRVAARAMAARLGGGTNASLQVGGVPCYL